MTDLLRDAEGLPAITGAEDEIHRITAREAPPYPAPLDLTAIDAACAVALHMHQPLIPAGGDDLRGAAIVGNLQFMMEHQDVGDNHNAPVFLWCYKRMAEFIPQLVDSGCAPRVMLEYSGTLLHGLRTMGAGDVLDALRAITTDPRYAACVEWLGCAWGHPVAPSTPPADYRLHVIAWQQHFASLFGTEALARVRGFSPAEMALPNHPDTAYEFVRTLRECGYRWVLVQEHTVERRDGGGVERPHVPHRLVCTSSRGETAEIIAIVKTQGSDTKLVAQMQPYYEARGLHPVRLGEHDVPPLVTQIADGENGGVMMNEFPPKYQEVVREASGSRTPLVTVGEYLDALTRLGVRAEDLPELQPLAQHRIWAEMSPGDGPERLARVIDELHTRDDRFTMEGGSWTSDKSWTQGYDNVLGPMDEASRAFHAWVEREHPDPGDPRYRAVLFHLMSAQTSCYRYWGQGVWTDYGAELARRATALAAGAGA